jgi:cytochrome c peroxidase
VKKLKSDLDLSLLDMKSTRIYQWTIVSAFVLLISACVNDPIGPIPYTATPLVIEKPLGLPPFEVNPLNPLTVEGVELGRNLFYDTILSADNTLSCGGCHQLAAGMTDDGNAVSVGIDGISGTRNAMPIFNLHYNPSFGTTEGGLPFGGFFWDSRAASLEEQALQPIEDPIEMHNTLGEVVNRLQAHEEYPTMFSKAFGTTVISTDLIGKAIGQFERSIISADAPYDRYVNGLEFWDDDAFDGRIIFNDLLGGDCFHCHGEGGGLFTDYTYRNNGLDNYTKASDFPDQGLMAISGDSADAGKFKVPTLRNLVYTAPYMHDGRFETLREVIDFYSEGVHDTPFTDQFIEFADVGGAQLSEEEKDQLEAFLISLSDESFVNNPDYQDPF